MQRNWHFLCQDVQKKGKGNNFKDISVRRQKVANTLLWLINDNPHYRDVKISQNYLNCLPEHGVPHDIIYYTETCDAYFGPKMQRIVFIMNTQK